MTNEKEYQSLIKKQVAIKEDILGVAAAIQKIDEGGARAIITAIQNTILSAVNIPLSIPKQLGYALAGPIGLFFSIREENKLKKYYARIAELETEYNKSATRIAELSQLVDKTALQKIEEEEARNANTQTNNNNLLIGLGVLATIVIVKRSQK